MRIVFSGASPTAIAAARALIKQRHDVVIIEVDKEKIDAISENLDGSFLHGDAAKPAILSQVEPGECDFLFCLTDNDQANIITSLLGRSMGFGRVITGIKDEDLLPLCEELELADIIVPTRTLSQHLTNIVAGLDNIELSTLLKGEARFFSFTAGSDDEGRIDALDLPKAARVMYYYRDGEFHFADSEDKVRKNDEIVILAHSEHLAELTERWHPKELASSE